MNSQPPIEEPPRSSIVQDRLGQIVGHVIRLSGLAVVFIHPNVSPTTLAFAAFLIAGGNGAETLINRLLGR